MAKARTPRDAWIEAALRALAAGGPEAVRVEALAAGLGVSKGGFYWHFQGRGALLEEALDTWERGVVGDVIARIEAEPAEPRAKLRRLFELASDPSVKLLLAVEPALRDWARRDADVAARLRRADNRRIEYLRALFAPICVDEDDVEARCIIALSMFIGGKFIRADFRGGSRYRAMRLALDHLLVATPPPPGPGALR